MSEPQKLLLEIERLNKEIIKLKEVIENKMRMLSLKINILHALKNYFDNEKKGEPTIF